MGVNTELLLLVKSSELGEGEPDLGEKLMKSFLEMILESGNLPAKVIFFNSGIFLTTTGSQVTNILSEYEKHGSEILSCGTCLDYYDRKNKLIIGKPTNMKDTVQAILSFKKILTP